MILFNDNEPYVVDWLRNLYPEAAVSSASITDLTAEDVSGYDRVHLFAGIGGWEYALSLAGWPADVPVWTGSCPCQPFSTAGKRRGTADERHLWPEMLRLIDQCRPPVIFGEQVASKDGRIWLAGVRADLEALGYAVGCADLCAAGVGAPHIRQRLYWVAYAERYAAQPWRATGQPAKGTGAPPTRPHDESGRHGDTGGVAYAGYGQRGRQDECRPDGKETTERHQEADNLERHSEAGGLGDTDSTTRQFDASQFSPAKERIDGERQPVYGPEYQRPEHASSGMGTWGRYDLLPCLDGKTRRVEPGTFPLAARVPSTVGRIRAYGGSIVPQVAAEFIKAFMDTCQVQYDMLQSAGDEEVTITNGHR